MTGAAAASGVGKGGAGTLTISFSPTAVAGFSDTGATANITTGSVTATITGNVGALTYAWALVGVEPYTWTIGTPAGATTNFTAQNVEVGVHTAADFELTVTDSIGNSGKKRITADVRNQVTDFGFREGGGVIGGERP